MGTFDRLLNHAPAGLSPWLTVFAFAIPSLVAGGEEKATNLLEPVCAQQSAKASRRRPGALPRLRYADPDCDPDRLPSAPAETREQLTPIPDRWRIVEALGYPVNWLDPYHGSNPLKGDRPVFGEDWFVNLNLSSSSFVEPRSLPVSRRITDRFGNYTTDFSTQDQLFFNQNFIFDAILYKGDTVFRPPEYQVRLTPVINYNQTSDRRGSSDHSLFAVQSLFVEKYLRDASEHYDFDSVRIGIQPFTSDFRGFLLLDQQLGVRFFGTRDNNIFQYNLAWLRRFRKNNVSLNDLGKDLPDNDVFVFNLYWQDLFQLGYTSQWTVVYNRSREPGIHIVAGDPGSGGPATTRENARHDYDIVYIGYNGDGHFDRLNLTGSLYYAIGQEANGAFIDSTSAVRAFFAAGELSMDFDWLRLRLSGLHGSGDDNPFDRTSEGFDGIFQNPIFAGTDFSYFIHEGLPLIDDTVGLKRRNSLLNSMRSRNDPGQSNFTNPGINLIGIGADFDLLPELRVTIEANQIWFDETAVLEATSGKPTIASDVGQDFSIAAIYRPFTTQNIILRFSAATLLPGQGYRDLYDARTPYYFLTNLMLTY